eukprot:9286873-Lingulodinium_polyedra.AAC.1
MFADLPGCHCGPVSRVFMFCSAAKAVLKHVLRLARVLEPWTVEGAVLGPVRIEGVARRAGVLFFSFRKSVLLSPVDHEFVGVWNCTTSQPSLGISCARAMLWFMAGRSPRFALSLLGAHTPAFQVMNVNLELFWVSLRLSGV